MHRLIFVLLLVGGVTASVYAFEIPISSCSAIFNMNCPPDDISDYDVFTQTIALKTDRFTYIGSDTIKASGYVTQRNLVNLNLYHNGILADTVKVFPNEDGSFSHNFLIDDYMWEEDGKNIVTASVREETETKFNFRYIDPTLHTLTFNNDQNYETLRIPCTESNKVCSYSTITIDSGEKIAIINNDNARQALIEYIVNGGCPREMIVLPPGQYGIAQITETVEFKFMDDNNYHFDGTVIVRGVPDLDFGSCDRQDPPKFEIEFMYHSPMNMWTMDEMSKEDIDNLFE